MAIRLDDAAVAVPASIGNVGPGFDALSVAVQLYLHARIVEVIDDGAGRIDCAFTGRQPVGENRVARAFAAMRERHTGPLPSIAVEIQSDIPMRAGLGSSAAAVVAGLRLFDRLRQGYGLRAEAAAEAGESAEAAATADRVRGDQPASLETLLAVAACIEGHPDNAAAALCGGLSACCQREDGTFTAWSWPWPEAIALIVATPAIELETAVARRVVPASVPRADAVFNLQHTLLLLRALESGDRGSLREALRDRWHQPYRQALVPGLDQLLALDHPDVLGVCLSGSGPSVVAFADRHHGTVEALLGDTYRGLGIDCTVRCLRVHQKGS